MAKAVTLKKNNEEVYPVTDISLVNGEIPTARIADEAVTGAKINWATVYEDISGAVSSSVPINFARKYADGRLVCFQRYAWTNQNVTSAWGGCYTGSFMTTVNYAVAFTAIPIVSATPTLLSGGNCWTATNGENGFSTATHPPAYQLVRPTSVSGTNGYLDIVAYGFWK